MKIKLALFYGGPSGEHEVSCISAASVFKHLDRDSYEIFPIGISKTGRWYLQKLKDMDYQSLPLAESQDSALAVHPGQGIFAPKGQLLLDAAFLITHGISGEDGRLQGLLDLVGLPYTGSGVLGSAVGMDKAVAKQLWQYNELPVVPFLQSRAHQHRRDKGYDRSLFQEAEKRFGLPLFVKPANSGSSVGVSRVGNFDEFLKALQTAFAVDDKILVEPAVDAREIEVAVLGTEDPLAFTPGEIVPSHEFYDYEAKYTDPQGARLVIPAELSPEISAKVQTLAVEAFLACEARGFARVDFFLDRTTGKVYLNEINTLPGFTTISMFPRMCVAGGLTYSQILNTIIQDSLKTRS